MPLETCPKHICRECGTDLKALGLRPTAIFCTPAHRKAWNNRRMIRGAELYDLIMAQNYERDQRKPLELQSLISRLASVYRDADKALRDGRKSWDVKEAIARMPLTYSTEGDKR